MSRKIILTESQFKDFLRVKLNENNGINAPLLNENEIKEISHKLIDNNFDIYFGNGKIEHCDDFSKKGIVLESLHSSPSRKMNDGRIKLFNKNYGYFFVKM